MMVVAVAGSIIMSQLIKLGLRDGKSLGQGSPSQGRQAWAPNPSRKTLGLTFLDRRSRCLTVEATS